MGKAPRHAGTVRQGLKPGAAFGDRSFR